MFFEGLVCLLGKHGVAINDVNVNKTGEVKIDIDFSEHDKPFKVKIRELEESYQKNAREIFALEKEVINYKQAFEDKCKDYDFTSELLNKYVAENESLERRIQELDTIDTIRIDENRELKQRIAELESKEMENFSEIDTSNPLACAESLIEHMTHCEKFMIMPERDVQTFSVEELKEIADYLMVYYKHHRDRDAEDTISF